MLPILIKCNGSLRCQFEQWTCSEDIWQGPRKHKRLSGGFGWSGWSCVRSFKGIYKWVTGWMAGCTGRIDTTAASKCRQPAGHTARKKTQLQPVSDKEEWPPQLDTKSWGSREGKSMEVSEATHEEAALPFLMRCTGQNLFSLVFGVWGFSQTTVLNLSFMCALDLLGPNDFLVPWLFWIDPLNLWTCIVFPLNPHVLGLRTCIDSVVLFSD